MTSPWEGEWRPTDALGVRVRIVPTGGGDLDLHLHFPAASQHPMAGVDLIVPRLDAEEVMGFFERHGMTHGWTSPLPRLAPRRSRRAEALVGCFRRVSHDAPLAVAL
ncbi:MAG: hypothetical protein EP329_08050 [Deltaproteobacteria bacterium]|nr:MAG: hypothetical protein EP329_08050 [Deltaproteobacteria bacterium]